MNLRTLRYLDRKLGVPLCYFFYFIKKITYFGRQNRFDKDKIKKILVIKIWGIGSIILASPTFQNLRENFPNAEIWFLTKDDFQNIYPTKFFDRIETIKLRGVFSAILDFIRLVFNFRMQKFDLVIDLEIVSRYTALLTYFSGAKTKVGFEILGQNKDKLYDLTAGYHESRHISKTFLGTLKVLGLKIKNYSSAEPEFLSEHEQRVGETLSSQKIDGSYIVININASELSFERRLPLEHFDKILRDLFGKHPQYKIILIGSAQDQDYVQNFINQYSLPVKNMINLAGNLSLPELFVLLKNAALVISNDSGPAHIAGAFGVPLVVFFGPESPTIYGPTHAKSRIFYSNIHCSPCISVYRDKKINCRYNFQCLTSFEVLDIYEEVKKILR